MASQSPLPFEPAVAPGGAVAHTLTRRALPAEAGSYRFRSLNVLSTDGEDVKDILLTAQGLQKWNGAPALLFHRRDGARDITFALDPPGLTPSDVQKF